MTAKKTTKKKRTGKGQVRKEQPGDRDPKTGRLKKGAKCGHRFTGPKTAGPGRKKGADLTAALRRCLDEKHAKRKGKTNGEVLIEEAVKFATDGDFRFFEHIFERMHGKVADKSITATSSLSQLSDEELLSIVNGEFSDIAGH